MCHVAGDVPAASLASWAHLVATAQRPRVQAHHPSPYSCRKATEADERAHTFIGECYVLGAMGGEALSHLRDELEALEHYLGPCGRPVCDAKLERFTTV